MTGFIITGHGQFASGMASAIKLITGPQEHLEIVDFEGDSIQNLKEDLKQAYQKLISCEDIIVFTDFLGGSPFQMAVEVLKKENSRVHVLSGTNLGMLCEAVMSRLVERESEELLAHLIATGKGQIVEFQFVEKETVIEEEI